ncbi:hypothetical protein [Streptomyces klenkii]
MGTLLTFATRTRELSWTPDFGVPGPPGSPGSGPLGVKVPRAVRPGPTDGTVCSAISIPTPELDGNSKVTV